MDRMDMTLTLESAVALLNQHHMLREVIDGEVWTSDPAKLPHRDFTDISYDTRTVCAKTLLFCKGRFSPTYLKSANELGLSCYVSQEDFSEYTDAIGIIVKNVSQAMSLLSAAFFDFPQRDLTVIGITGTKGKTTTAYFTQAILNAYSDGKTALLSSVDNCLDGRHYEESDLTTPESMDLFRMMHQAKANGMRYLVMEVSSQAYKVDRVYGLHFDVGAFLNITPDHISSIEHPTFEDYLYCKRQIIANSSRMVIGADSQHRSLLEEDAQREQIPLYTFALRPESSGSKDADVVAVSSEHTRPAFDLYDCGEAIGTYTLAIEGDFNEANAAAAVAIVRSIDVPDDDPSLHAMDHIRISGRMERFTSVDGTIAYVDYAHNYASIKALVDFVYQRYGERNPRITLVTGSAGNKALDRREGIVKAAQDRIARFIFTTEDTDTEANEDICAQLMSHVTNPSVEAGVILDRTQAITEAYRDARRHLDRLNVLLITGKGEERWIKDMNKHVAYEGDNNIIARLFKEASSSSDEV
jgi:UDP-N-acetylmuramoyl-L-alanyl-D-glutamate--2,6-diaminopimelate ligase